MPRHYSTAAAPVQWAQRPNFPVFSAGFLPIIPMRNFFPPVARKRATLLQSFGKFPGQVGAARRMVKKDFRMRLHPEVLVGDGGFEPPKALPADLQSVPFGHSGNPPYTIWNWSWWTDSNPRPADYKSAALPAELHQHLASEPYYNRGFLNCQLQTSHESRKFIALKLCNIHKRT